MAAPTENPIILNIMSSYGGLLTGTYIAQAVWGVSTLQTFFYYKNFEHDKIYLKLLVAILWCLDTANQILILKGNYKVLILQYGRIAGLLDNQIETTIHTWIEAIVTFIVQLYFIRRIYIFGSKHKWMKPFCAVLVALASWQVIGIIIYWVWAFGKPLLEQTKPRSVDDNVSLRAAAVVVDVVVSVCMIWLLTWNRGHMLNRTRKMVFRILIVTVNSGTWTALFALFVLILVKVYPNDLYFCIPEFSLCSLYFSTFLANLNSRNYVKGDGSITTLMATTETDNTANSGRIVLRPMGRQPQSLGSTTMMRSDVLVTKESEVYVEPEYVSHTKEEFATA
jgi:hypothetical protein